MVPKGFKLSAHRWEFFLFLGFQDPRHVIDRERAEHEEAIFQEMWLEVTNYWHRCVENSTDRRILKPDYAANSKIQQPYKWAHLDPAFIDGSIRSIWKDGEPTPRQYYDMGYSDDDPKHLNWVVKWLLWHVSRYRDWRNKKRKPRSVMIGEVATTTVATTSSASTTMPPRDFWTTVMN